MPQLRHQGKYVYGWSVIGEENTLHFPPDVISEYMLEESSDIVLFSSSKISGGFCISKLETLKSSKLSKIVEDNPTLEMEGSIGQIVTYKGKSYCHVKLSGQNSINLCQQIVDYFNVKHGDKLLIIRGSNIAFDCLLKGPLVEVANESNMQIKIY